MSKQHVAFHPVTACLVWDWSSLVNNWKMEEPWVITTSKKNLLFTWFFAYVEVNEHGLGKLTQMYKFQNLNRRIRYSTWYKSLVLGFQLLSKFNLFHSTYKETTKKKNSPQASKERKSCWKKEKKTSKLSFFFVLNQHFTSLTKRDE